MTADGMTEWNIDAGNLEREIELAVAGRDQIWLERDDLLEMLEAIDQKE